MNKVIFIDDDKNKHEFFSVNRFDCKVLDFQATERGGKWMTVIPISPLDFRMKCPTGAFVEVSKESDWTRFTIGGDGAPHWGIYQVLLHNSLSAEIEAAINAAKENGLLVSGE